MSTWKIVAILLAIGATFDTLAVEMECKMEPHVGSPVCYDMPLGPRFTVRR